MANPQHVAWLREGVESWNHRRSSAPFEPDLSSEDVSLALGGHERQDIRQISVNLRGVNLIQANLRDATLRDTDLTKAFFAKADLTNADLQGSVFERCRFVGTMFRNANLTHSKLPGARFWHCDLSLAKLVASDLSSAFLYGCILKGAHLYNADVKRTKIVASDPWKARLFWPPENRFYAEFDNAQVKKTEDLLQWCRSLRMAHGNSDILYFRGETRCEWSLQPSLMREPSLRTSESDMLTDLMTRQPDDFQNIDRVAMEWVFAQHHGLPTRVLDVTRNPLVALYFACEDADQHDGRIHVFAVPKRLVVPFNGEEATYVMSFAKLSREHQDLLLGKSPASIGDGAPDLPNPIEAQRLFTEVRDNFYALVRRDDPSSIERLDWRNLFRVFVLEPQRTFERLKAQAGAFLISAFHERFEQTEIGRFNREIPSYGHYRLTVSASTKKQLRDDLRFLNVTRDTLFPSADEAASAITREYTSGQ